MIAIATTTWNSVDIVESFLEHHLGDAITRVFVVEYGSDDGTAEILQRYAERDLVEVLHLPTLADKDTSNLLLAHINGCGEPFRWCLFIDPDEFVSSPHALLEQLTLVPDDTTVVSLPRFNMTGRRREGVMHVAPFIDLNLKIKERKRRTVEERRGGELDPPWIFTHVPGKVAVRVPSESRIGPGDHSASGSTGYTLDAVEVLHFPVRSWAKFEEKVRMAERDLQANQALSPNFAWHWRRWIAIRERGELFAEYLCQFISEDKIQSLMRDGIIECIDGTQADGLRDYPTPYPHSPD